MFSELSSRVGVRPGTERGREREVSVKRGRKGGWREKKQVCPRNLQMKREGFSLNAIKFFHSTASPADSFSSLEHRAATQCCCLRDGMGGGGGHIE